MYIISIEETENQKEGQNMDVLAASMGVQAIAMGTQANAMMMKNAMMEQEQTMQAILEMLPNVNPAVNPPHLGKHIDVFA